MYLHEIRPNAGKHWLVEAIYSSLCPASFSCRTKPLGELRYDHVNSSLPGMQDALDDRVHQLIVPSCMRPIRGSDGAPKRGLRIDAYVQWHLTSCPLKSDFFPNITLNRPFAQRRAGNVNSENIILHLKQRSFVGPPTSCWPWRLGFSTYFRQHVDVLDMWLNTASDFPKMYK